MNRFKIYLRTNGHVEEQAKTYAEVFGGKILKESFFDQMDKEQLGTDEDVRYAYVQIASNLTIMISKVKPKMPPRGYNSDIIITYDNLDEFEATYRRLIQSDKFIMDFEKTEKPWAGGRFITKFYDQWGYGWILEIKKDTL